MVRGMPVGVAFIGIAVREEGTPVSGATFSRVDGPQEGAPPDEGVSQASSRGLPILAPFQGTEIGPIFPRAVLCPFGGLGRRGKLLHG